VVPSPGTPDGLGVLLGSDVESLILSMSAPSKVETYQEAELSPTGMPPDEAEGLTLGGPDVEKLVKMWTYYNDKFAQISDQDVEAEAAYCHLMFQFLEDLLVACPVPKAERKLSSEAYLNRNARLDFSVKAKKFGIELKKRSVVLGEAELTQLLMYLKTMAEQDGGGSSFGLLTNTDDFYLGSVTVSVHTGEITHTEWVSLSFKMIGNMDKFGAFFKKHVCPTINFENAFKESKVGMQERIESLEKTVRDQAARIERLENTVKRLVGHLEKIDPGFLQTFEEIPSSRSQMGSSGSSGSPHLSGNKRDSSSRPNINSSPAGKKQNTRKK
jgi:uncharacterized coiled-coil protein SlyX